MSDRPQEPQNLVGLARAEDNAAVDAKWERVTQAVANETRTEEQITNDLFTSLDISR